MKALLFSIALVLVGCDKFEGAAIDANKIAQDTIKDISVSQSQRDAENVCAARINSGEPRPNSSGYPVTYPTVKPPQFKTTVLGYEKYRVQTLLDVPNALVPFIAECVVERGKIISLVSD